MLLRTAISYAAQSTRTLLVATRPAASALHGVRAATTGHDVGIDLTITTARAYSVEHCDTVLRLPAVQWRRLLSLFASPLTTTGRAPALASGLISKI
jgi:hypothetical protein